MRLEHVRQAVSLGVACLVAAGCSTGGRILANDPPPLRSAATPTPTALAAVDPQPVVLPRDDSSHHRLTEWWYYTGHLRTDAGRRYGFELVVFRAERGSFPVTWASHLALTDETAGTFRYDQRSEIGPQVDGTSAIPDDQRAGFDLSIAGGDPLAAPASRPTAPTSVGPAPPALGPAPPALGPAPGYVTPPPWRMSGGGGRDHLDAATSGFGFQLDLDAGDRPVALHDHDGFLDYGPAGTSYYYSRPRMAATGTLTVDGTAAAVRGSAWFDHQWGDFVQVGAGGWDWYAINLDDGTDITLWLIRDEAGAYPLVYGTLVRSDRTVSHLDRALFTVRSTGTWTSPRTGGVYPAGWHVSLPGERLEIDLAPSVADQELDTRVTTGVTYWEGSQRLTATRDGHPLAGEAYVELTGYGPNAGPVTLPQTPNAAAPRADASPAVCDKRGQTRLPRAFGPENGPVAGRRAVSGVSVEHDIGSSTPGRACQRPGSWANALPSRVWPATWRAGTGRRGTADLINARRRVWHTAARPWCATSPHRGQKWRRPCRIKSLPHPRRASGGPSARPSPIIGSSLTAVPPGTASVCPEAERDRRRGTPSVQPLETTACDVHPRSVASIAASTSRPMHPGPPIATTARRASGADTSMTSRATARPIASPRWSRSRSPCARTASGCSSTAATAAARSTATAPLATTTCCCSSGWR
jgi:predicted secreted hydrolase